MSDDVDHIQQLASCLTATAREAESVRRDHGLDPAQDSLMAEILKIGSPFVGRDLSVLVLQASVLPWYQLLSAQDHMHALAVALSDPDTGLWSPATLARAIVEASVWAWWLYQPAPDLTTPLSQMVNVTALAVADLFPDDPEGMAKVNTVMATIAKRLDLPYNAPEGGRRVGLVGQGPPKTSDLMGRVFGSDEGPDVWRRLAWIAHALPHGLARGLFGVRQEGTVWRLVKTEADQEQAAILAAYSLQAFCRAVMRQHEFWGWSPRHWQGWMDHVQSVIDAAPAADRFGR